VLKVSINRNSAFTQAFALSSSVPLPAFSAQVFVVWPAAWAGLVQASLPEEACVAPDAGLPEAQALLEVESAASQPVRSASVEVVWLPAALVPVAPSAAAPEDEPADSAQVGSVVVSARDDSALA
jgi:hypothetical protein